MKWNGLEWNGMGWDRMGRNRTEETHTAGFALWSGVSNGSHVKLRPISGDRRRARLAELGNYNGFDLISGAYKPDSIRKGPSAPHLHDSFSKGTGVTSI